MFEKPAQARFTTAVILLRCCLPLLISFFCFTAPWSLKVGRDMTIAYPLWPLMGWVFGSIGAGTIVWAIVAGLRSDREALKQQEPPFVFDESGRLIGING